MKPSSTRPAPRRGAHLVKSEPSAFPWAAIERAGRVVWDGVRNALAQRHLAAMAPGDLVFVYHTGAERAVVGLARVASAPRPDATDPAGKAVCVELEALGPAKAAVPLATLKSDARFAGLALLRQPRLSVLPVDPTACDALLTLGGFPAPS